MRPALLALAAAVLLLPATATAVDGPALTVDASAGRHAIAPEIYGMNGADPALAQEIGLPVDRWGGNDRERYNWRLATKNTGRDWFYENVADCFQHCITDAGHDAASDGAYLPMLARDRLAGGTTVLQVPLIGWVAKDRPVEHPFTCGFPIDTFGLQASFDPWEEEWRGCGNGVTTAGQGTLPDQPYREPEGSTRIAPGDPTQTSTPFGPQDAKDWIAYLRANGHPLPAYYELGNEPNLWDDSHRDVHPTPTTFEELKTKSVAMATALKEADPQGKVMGYSEWGWTHYFCSAKDETGAGSWGCQPTDTDRAAHDGAELSAWYLRQMKAASETAHTRLLDLFDLHYYNQGDPPQDAARSLWDPTFATDTWIHDTVRLIPRMHDWVDQNYPGTGIALSEYNLSNDLSDTTSVTATLLEAEALGVFARERVDLAAMWAPPEQGDRVANAFRLYRNYDGAGGRFGTTYVSSASADERQVAVFGAERADGALTVAVLNKSAVARTVPLALSGFAAGGPAQVWQWTGGAFARLADVDVVAGGAALALPASSMTMLVVPKPGGGGGTETTPTTTTPQPTVTTPAPTVTTPAPPPTTPTTTVPVTPTPPAGTAKLGRATRVALKGRAVPLALACPARTAGCRGTVTLARGRTTLGTVRFSVAAGKTKTVRVALAARRLKEVRGYGHRGRSVTATVRGPGKPVARTLTLRSR
jgi:hypothetical protein